VAAAEEAFVRFEAACKSQDPAGEATEW
jgi:hypothetical protein